MAEAGTLGARFGLDAEEASALRSVIGSFAEESGFDYLSLFDRVDAGESLLSALGLPAQTVSLMYAQAHARYNAGDLARAHVLFQTLTLLAPEERDHWLGFGISLRALGQFETAILVFETAVRLDRDGAVANYHLAEALAQAGQKAAALAAVEAGLAAPDSPDRHLVAPELERLRAALSGAT